MGFFLSGERDRALMALAIKKAQEVFQVKPGGYLGRTALQKIMYFLVRRGVPLRYRFDIHLYGPFSSEIYHDIECLMADGIIEDKAGKEKGKDYSNYRPGEKLEELLKMFDKDVRRYKQTVKEVVEIFADMRPEALELVATLDYLYQDLKALKERPPTKQAVVDRFMKVKKDKFPKSQVENVYDILIKARIFAGSSAS